MAGSVLLVHGLVLAAVLVATFEFGIFARGQRWLPNWLACLAGMAAPPVGLALLAVWGREPVPAGVWPVLVVAQSFWLPRPCYAGSALLAAGLAAALTPGARPAVAAMVAAVAVAGAWPGVRHRALLLAGVVLAAWAAAAAGGWPAAGGRLPVRAALPVEALAGLAVAGYILSHEQRLALLREAETAAEADALTGARTRRGLERWLAQWAEPPPGVVVAADLDDFKTVNDTYGHVVGDEILREFAARLRGALREGDAVVRPGGDEFTCWCPGVSPAAAPELVARLHETAVGTPFATRAGPLRLGCPWAGQPALWGRWSRKRRMGPFWRPSGRVRGGWWGRWPPRAPGCRRGWRPPQGRSGRPGWFRRPCWTRLAAWWSPTWPGTGGGNIGSRETTPGCRRRPGPPVPRYRSGSADRWWAAGGTGPRPPGGPGGQTRQARGPTRRY
ncbi:putative Diguanylate cyclase [Candidatus Hydrogenisulfobacillus filiaventi]|uniref:Putative Diguanylate cyclase n=1 Tax=Candidatus Hydrogenisulfobacillus filiaventi TaxID=2707344 RepID=A0A6F8ZKL9_9FIRM|nr:putative Diguanylate cyclase [Candidatus Hydrogenisulfobacillus filiaventi]